MKRMRIICRYLFLYLLVNFYVIAVPNLVNFQGTLSDLEGNPVSGAKTIIFSIYAAVDATTPLWQETQSVQIIDGLYVVQLGSVTQFTDTLFAEPELWLGVKVLGDDEQTPRIRIIAVPYALRSKTADKAEIADTVGENAIETGHLQDGAVVTSKLSEASVTEAKLADFSVSESKVVDGAVTTSKLADDSVSNVKLQDGLVTEFKIADGAVIRAKLAENSVDATKIIDGAVTTGKIGDQSITVNKLADSAVTSDKISNANVTTVKIADEAVTSEKLAADSVLESHIKDGAITKEKLNPSISGVPIGGIVISDTKNDQNLISNGYTFFAAVQSRPTDTWEPITNENAPAHRVYHSATYTGEKMIIWGGRTDHIGYTNSGGIYDIDSDSWVSINTFNAPEPRANHIAVWTGTEMIIWGGDSREGGSAVGLNTGGRYDPETLIWRPTTLIGDVPSSRTNTLGVWTGEKLVIFGGQEIGGNVTNTGSIYDPLTDSWQSTSTVNAPSIWNAPEYGVHSWAFWTGNDIIAIRGGDGHIWSFELDSNTWTDDGDTLKADVRLLAIDWIGNRQLFAYGLDGPHEVTAMYDLNTKLWTISRVNRYRVEHVVDSVIGVWTGSEFVVWGSIDGSVRGGKRGLVFNPSHLTWKEITQLPNAIPQRPHFTMINSHAGVLIWGGFQGVNNSNTVGDGRIYHPEKERNETFLYIKE